MKGMEETSILTMYSFTLIYFIFWQRAHSLMKMPYLGTLFGPYFKKKNKEAFSVVQLSTAVSITFSI